MTDQPTLFDQPIEEETRRDSFGIVPTRFAGLTRFELLAQQGVPPVPMNLTIDPTRLSRAQDPDTSRKAAESASRRGPSQRRRVWEALKKRVLTY
jgi:hypothetical protein